MDRGKAGLTVFFEGPFWVGVFERIEDGKLSVCRVVFGSEPRDYEVWEFILKNYYSLKFSPAVETAVKDGRVNPKRRQREAGRQTYPSFAGPGSCATNTASCLSSTKWPPASGGRGTALWQTWCCRTSWCWARR